MEKEIVRELVTFRNTEEGRKNLVEGEIYKLEMKANTYRVGELSTIVKYIKYDSEYNNRPFNNLPLRFQVISTGSDLKLGSDGLLGWDLRDDGEIFTRLTYDNDKD